VTCPLADSYVELAAQEAGSAAELAATCKLAKYSALAQNQFELNFMTGSSAVVALMSLLICV